MTDDALSEEFSTSPGDLTLEHITQQLELTSAYQDEAHRHSDNILPNLPSHRFRFSVWHDLSNTSVKGSDLKAPRIRDGPLIKHEMFYKLQDANGRRIHHSRRGKECQNYQDATENWHNVLKCNLSYQDLSHNYQMENFIRVLSKLRNVEQLNLTEDGLTDLSTITLPRCVTLNMCRNNLRCFKNLPKISRIQHLNLDDNVLDNLKGLDNLRKTPITHLSLRRNPVSFTPDYRTQVFSRLTGLKYLDGLPKQLDDEQHDAQHDDTSSCVIS